MLPGFAFLGLVSLFGVFSPVVGLGSKCSAPLASGTSAPSDSFWLETITQRGSAPYSPDPITYPVFRNVKDYGAVGDGVTDDTAAINNAISTGGRCGFGCNSTTVLPALVYFPQGTYLVSTPLLAYYYTQLVGDAKVPPTLLASPNFTGIAVIDADPYTATGQWFVNQDNFFRSVRNVVIDLTRVPANVSATGLHWQVSQATSLVNVVVNMSTAPGNDHQGIYMESGSGGFMGDLVFNGGKYGINVGNQQFTVRNITVNNAATAIYGAWNWGWTFQSVFINNCSVGFQLVSVTTATQGVGGEAIIDAVVTDTPIFIQSSLASNGSLAGSLVLNNIQLNNVSVAVGVADGSVVLEGGTTTIESWAQGNVYSGSNQQGTFTQGPISAPPKSQSLLSDSGRIVSRGHPQYIDYAPSQFMSVKSAGATGDGVTDDTAALQAVFDQYAGCYIIFFDAGVYIVTSTLRIPEGTQVVGEAWSVIAGKGQTFADMNLPTPVVRVGEPLSCGIMEITDIIFKTVGPAPGAIVVEWNVAEPEGVQAGAGTWDTHIILGGAVGTDLELAQCPAGSVSNECFAAFLALHLTIGSTAYLEGMWVWLADHDLDGDGYSQLTLFSGRGILSQSSGPVWMIGTAEHHTLYDYSLAYASNHYMGLIQTETPYYQPIPAPPAPFFVDSGYLDPLTYPSAAWALHVQASTDIIIFGAGHYSFFQNYTQTCLTNYTCQQQIVDTDWASSLYVYSLATVGSTYQLSVDDQGVIPQSFDRDGFSSTATAWTPC